MHVAGHLRCRQMGVTSGLWDVYSHTRRLFGKPVLHEISPAGVSARISTCARWIPIHILQDNASIPVAASQASVRESSNVVWLKTGRNTDSLPPRNRFTETGIKFQFTSSWILNRAAARAWQPRSCLEQRCSFWATATSKPWVRVQEVWVVWILKVTGEPWESESRMTSLQQQLFWLSYGFNIIFGVQVHVKQ